MDKDRTASEPDDTEADASPTPGEIGDRPEADVLEQSEVVEEQQSVQRSPRPPDADEADWLEQSVAENLDDDRR
ncbi:MAG TPA: hypothetical protein VKR22_01045 [Acidimicrobiales bacterium]|nr:hypothetical protein [Acidimicrobiales bacterium]